MTAVVARKCRGYVEIGADSRVTLGNLSTIQAVKLTRFPWGAIGVAGTGRVEGVLNGIASGCDSFASAVAYAEKRLAEPDQMLLTDGRTIAYTERKSTALAQRYAAIGSGGEVALGAIAAGATVRRALQIASDLCPTVGPPFTVLRIRYRETEND